MTVEGNYLAAYRVHGLMSLPEGEDVELLMVSDPNATVILTTRPDEHCLHLDRQGTIGAMALNAILGRSQGDASAFLDAGMRSAKKARDKQGTGVYLILNATGDLGEPNFTHRGERDEFIVHFDAFSKTAFRDRAKLIIDSALAAVSLSLDE